MVKCPYCGYESEFKLIKNWHFRFYDVKMFEYHRRRSVLNQNMFNGFYEREEV